MTLFNQLYYLQLKARYPVNLGVSELINA